MSPANLLGRLYVDIVGTTWLIYSSDGNYYFIYNVFTNGIHWASCKYIIENWIEI